MYKLTKLVGSFLLMLMLGTLLAGCAGTPAPTAAPTAEPVVAATDAPSAAPTAQAASDSEKLKIGVIQFVQHAALDASYQGFIDALKESGYVDGENIEIEYLNASGDQSNCQTIADGFVNGGKDLVLAIATPAAQAIAMKTTDIPILITAVTDPQDAGLVETNALPNTNVSGTSDLTPIAEQIDLIKQVVPDAKKVAILYNSGEANSVFQANLAKEAASALGLEAIDATVSNSNEIQQVVTSIIDKVDAIYAPTDNMIANGMATVALVTTPAKIPVFCGESGMVNAGGLITYGINYHDLGLKTGQQAVRILKGEDITKMPIEYLDKSELEVSVNLEVAEAIGITLPEELLAQAAK